MNWQDALAAMLPEHHLLAGIVILILLELWPATRRAAFAVSLLATAAAALAAFLLYAAGLSAVPFPGQFSLTPSASLAKAAVLALAVPVVLMSREEFPDGPFYTLLLSSLYGACLMLSSDSFLTLFLGLELLSLPVYVLVLLALRRVQAGEAALKYLVLGGAASATLLMGVSLLYGSTGSLALSAFTDALAAPTPMATGGVVLVLAAFFLKAAVVPFHAWAPDAYEGASVPVTGYMATIVKATVLLAAVRLFGSGQPSPAVIDLLAILPLASIVWGNLAAMKQEGFRRMIAYSSIAHAGYLYFAFLGAAPGRFEAVFFYVLVYGLMNLLAFACIPPAEDDAARDRLGYLKGLFHRDPYAAVMIGIAMLSLAGIPPLPGFAAKFLIFKNVVAAGYTTYAVLGLVGSYLGIYFYLRVIQYMFMSPASAGTPAGHVMSSRLAVLASLVCLVPTVLLMVFPGWVIGRL